MNRFEPPFEIHVHGQVVLRPDVTLQQLMADTDTQKILTKSKYKPKLMK